MGLVGSTLEVHSVYFLKQQIKINSFAGVGNDGTGIVWNKSFCVVRETFFVNNNYEFDKQKTFPL